MFTCVVRTLRTSWKSLVVTDLVFKAIAFCTLLPIVSFAFRMFLAASGRTVIADADIAKFLIHPLGWLAFVVVGGAIVCITALEQATLMTVCMASTRGSVLRVRDVFPWVAGKSAAVLQLTSRVVAHLGMLALPFIAAGGGVYWMLLTDHDINFYLAHKPPKFLLACGLIGFILLIMAGLLLYRILGWAFALQILLYEQVSPLESLQQSRARSVGHRKAILFALLAWAMLNAILGMVVSLLVIQAGRVVVPLAVGSLWSILIAVGAVISLVTLGNLLANMLSNASCAAVLSQLYVRLASAGDAALPDLSEQARILERVHWTPARMLVGCILCVLIAAGIGAATIHGVDLNDQVEITAHRGGAGVAPENTLAAIRMAIDAGADWVEIDVQETKDGVVVVAHDSDLKKVADNALKIWDATAEELGSIDIGSYFDREFKDQRVPTLDEVLSLCKNRVGVNIELKYYGHTQDLERRVVELVEQHQMQSEIVIMSLEADAVHKMKQLRPEWTVGLLTAVAAGDLTRAEADFLAVNSSLATRGFIEAAHRRGKTVSAWTINDRYLMSTMISRGVDDLITDYPALARSVLAERKALSPVERLLMELALYLGVKPKPDGAQ